MDFTRRLGDSSDSNSDDLEIQLSDQPKPSSSPLTRMREDDVEAMLRKTKQLKTTTTTLVPSPVSKMNWTKNDELVILGGIVDYENETKLSYRSDCDAFYHYIKDSVEANFSKKQLIDKVKNLKWRFTYNQARVNDGKGLSFANTDDYELFQLSKIIWAKNETEDVSNENVDQSKDVSCAEQVNKDVPCVEQEHTDVSCEEQVNKDMPCAEQENTDVPCEEQVNKDVPCAEPENEHVPCEEQVNKDVPCAEPERVSVEIDNGEEGESEEDGVDDELYVMEDTLMSGISCQSLGKNGEEDGVDGLVILQDALKERTMFQRLSKYQQKYLLENMENLGAENLKELFDEWKALLNEELQFNIKKQFFSAKLASGGVWND